MKVLWICGLPRQVERDLFKGQFRGAYAEWSWILGHLPPPEGVELHIACGHHSYARRETHSYRGAFLHLVPVKIRARIYSLYQFDWLYYRELAALLKPDVIHGWGTEDAHAFIALKLAPKRHVIEIQGNLNTYCRRVPMPWQSRWLGAWSERLALARACHVCAENEYSIESARPMFRTPAAQAIEHPVRPGFLTATPATGEGRQILFLGSLDERKGVWDAVDAFRQGAPADWQLVVVGNGPLAAQTRLRSMMAQAGPGRLRHYPSLSPSEIITLMQASSLFLLPTRIDTGPTALKEALAMGLWPVCYDNSGPGHYIRKFGYGSLAADLNPTALQETLRTVIGHQPWRHPENREKVMSQIRPHFDRNRIWQELAGLYEKINRA